MSTIRFVQFTPLSGEPCFIEFFVMWAFDRVTKNSHFL